MNNKPPPFKGLNSRIPIILPTKGRGGFVNQGSTLGFDSCLRALAGQGPGPITYLLVKSFFQGTDRTSEIFFLRDPHKIPAYIFLSVFTWTPQAPCANIFVLAGRAKRRIDETTWHSSQDPCGSSCSPP